MVVFHHILHQSPGFLSLWPTAAWQAGVDLFFVISGFVMVFVTAARERSAPQFLAMRAARIIPVYWFYTLGAAVLVFKLPQLFRSNELSVKHVLLSMLFIPHQSVGTTSPLIKQGWTLNYEVFFYILFALAVAALAKRRVALAVTALITITAAGYLMEFLGLSIGTPGFYFNNIILEFAFGMLIASAYLRHGMQLINPILGGILVATGFIALFALDPFLTSSTRFLIYGVPAAAILIGVLSIQNRITTLSIPPLQFAGDASYSIYLVHIFPVAILRTLWPRLSLPMDGAASFILFMTLSVVLIIAMSAISYYAVERPSLKYLRKKIQLHLDKAHPRT